MLAFLLASYGAFEACAPAEVPPAVAVPGGELTTAPDATIADDGRGDGSSGRDGGAPDAEDAADDTGSGTPPLDAGQDASPPLVGPWPGPDVVTIVDDEKAFGKNVSGLVYVPAAGGAPARMWVVQNEPSTLFRLTWSGTSWTFDAAGGWPAPRALRFPDGTGAPDAEEITVTDPSSSNVYVASEKDGFAPARPSILLYDTSAPGDTLVAVREWQLGSDLPTVTSNGSLESITFLPDAYLVARRFRDERLGKIYSPADYPNHAGGLFMVGIEETGVLVVYALDHVGGGFHRVATADSGLAKIMSLTYDRDVGSVWAACDNTCAGDLRVLDIDPNAASTTFGRFVLRASLSRPLSMDNLNNEGITFAPESECVGGMKDFYWADDGEKSGHVIRRDAIPCGRFY